MADLENQMPHDDRFLVPTDHLHNFSIPAVASFHLSSHARFCSHYFRYDGDPKNHRVQRYLQLCAEDNMQIIMPTVPAQMFHLLRRQVLRKMRKPLIVMSPKSLLRHKLSVSTLDDICNDGFKPVIGEIDEINAANVERVILCSGKVYFDLLDARREREIDNIAIVRIEELYPFPRQLLINQLKLYSNATEIVWCQEEPHNQGAWQFVQAYLTEVVAASQKLSVISRPASASPAVGYYQKHIEQLQTLVNEAMGLNQSQQDSDEIGYREIQ